MRHDPWSLPTAVEAFARRLAQNAADPIAAFVHDLDALDDHAAWMRSHLPDNIELYYAMKANSAPTLLKSLASHVDGFDVSSGGELDHLLNTDLERPFVFSGPGKLDSELARAVAAGADRIHLESLAEIDRLARIAAHQRRRQPVLIRVNPALPATVGSRLAMAGRPTPFGLDEGLLSEAVSRVDASEHLELRGFHVHAQSHQRDVARHQTLLDRLLDKWPVWQSLAATPARVTDFNVGGGMGVNYLGREQYDWPALCRHLDRRLAWLPRAPRLRFEPGRFVSAFCGYYLMQVIDIKTTLGETFAIARGGTHHFRLPAAQGHDHPVVHLPIGPRRKGDPVERATLVGQLCTPKDVLSRNAPLLALQPGDVAVLPLAGAYGYNISHADFLCHPRPHQHFIRGRSARAAETDEAVTAL